MQPRCLRSVLAEVLAVQLGMAVQQCFQRVIVIVNELITDFFQAFKVLAKQTVLILKAGQGRRNFLVIFFSHEFANIL